MTSDNYEDLVMTLRRRPELRSTPGKMDLDDAVIADSIEALVTERDQLRAELARVIEDAANAWSRSADWHVVADARSAEILRLSEILDDVMTGGERGTDYGWLIEHDEHYPTHRWLSAVKYVGNTAATLEWTTDANTALRFSRKSDAIAFTWLHFDFCKQGLINEHGFSNAALAAGKGEGEKT